MYSTRKHYNFKYCNTVIQGVLHFKLTQFQKKIHIGKDKGQVR